MGFIFISQSTLILSGVVKEFERFDKLIVNRLAEIWAVFRGSGR